MFAAFRLWLFRAAFVKYSALPFMFLLPFFWSYILN